MPILLKTEIERTAKTPVTARRARVGGLCRFRRPAERVPAGSPKTGRCAAVRERCGNAKRRRRTPPGRFQQREKPQAAIAGQSRGVVRIPRRSHLPAVRAVWSFKRGVTERGKIAPVGSQFEKSPPFQGKRRGCTKKVHGKRKKQQVQRWVKQLRVYREKQLAGPKPCKLPSKKSMFYYIRDPARISRTIICRNNIDTYPPYWVLLVLRRVEGRFR